MLTTKHFEAIGRLVYQSSLMESRLCLWLIVLQGNDVGSWANQLQKFRFTEAIKELETYLNLAFCVMRSAYYGIVGWWLVNHRNSNFALRRLPTPFRIS